MKEKVSAEDRVREIRRKTRKKYSSEEKVRIVLEGLVINEKRTYRIYCEERLQVRRKRRKRLSQHQRVYRCPW